MTEPLFTPARAEAAYLRWLIRAEAEIAALRVIRRQSPAKAELDGLTVRTCLRAERAKISRETAELVAASEFDDALGALQAENRCGRPHRRRP